MKGEIASRQVGGMLQAEGAAWEKAHSHERRCKELGSGGLWNTKVGTMEEEEDLGRA